MLERLRNFLTGGKPRYFFIEFRDQTYSIISTRTAAEFLEWFERYAQKAPICATCRKLMLPGEGVGRNNDSFMHVDCCLTTTGGLFIGRLNEDGIIVPENSRPDTSKPRVSEKAVAS